MGQAQNHADGAKCGACCNVGSDMLQQRHSSNQITMCAWLMWAKQTKENLQVWVGQAQTNIMQQPTAATK
jgi:hypothetical protein